MLIGEILTQFLPLFTRNKETNNPNNIKLGNTLNGLMHLKTYSRGTSATNLQIKTTGKPSRSAVITTHLSWLVMNSFYMYVCDLNEAMKHEEQ